MEHNIIQQILNFLTSNIYPILTAVIIAILVNLINITFVKPYIQDKKEKIKEHHNSIIEILQEWSKLNVNTTNKKDDFYETAIPFYLNVIEEMELLDEYQEVISHLNSRKYSNIFSLYEKMKELEKNHNEKVSESMKVLEGKIMDQIANDEEIKLPDNDFIKRIFHDKYFLIE